MCVMRDRRTGTGGPREREGEEGGGRIGEIGAQHGKRMPTCGTDHPFRCIVVKVTSFIHQEGLPSPHIGSALAELRGADESLGMAVTSPPPSRRRTAKLAST